MNFSEELRIAGTSLVESVINSPRLAAATGTATGTLGAAMRLDWLQGTLSTVAMIAGIIMTLLLARLHWVNVKNGQITNKILLRQLAEMGAEPVVEKTP